MKRTDRSVDLLKLIRRPKQANAGNAGLEIVKVLTSNPSPVTLRFEGSQLPLDIEIFEVPSALMPLEEGARYFVLPIQSGGYNNRWGIIAKL